jgi:zinc/manganese transport system ATP-binding protein
VTSKADPVGVTAPLLHLDASTGPDAAPVVLSVEDIGVALGGRRILDQVSFSIPAGGFCGLIGSNGAGKTTLLRVILGLIPPSSGRVVVAGRAPSRRSPQIGYVPQKIVLEPDMPLRARDLVALGIDGHRFGLPRSNARRRQEVDTILEAVGGTPFADSKVGNLSGGEQQRVMIAHALISRPKLLLLDEPLANLDIRAAREVVDLLGHIAAEQHISVLLSAHDMNPLLPVMDHIVYLADGRAASGTTEEVVQTETLSRLYGHHVEVIHVQGRVLVVSGAEHQTHHSDDTGPRSERG